MDGSKLVSEVIKHAQCQVVTESNSLLQVSAQHKLNYSKKEVPWVNVNKVSYSLKQVEKGHKNSAWSLGDWSLYSLLQS